MYAGPRSYERYNRDLFSAARLALELFLDQEGKLTRLQVLTRNFLLIVKRMALLGLLSTGGCRTIGVFEKKLESVSHGCG